MLGKNLPIGLAPIDIRVSLGPLAFYYAKALETAKFVICNIYVIINEKLRTNIVDENILVMIYDFFYRAQTTTYRRCSPLRSSPLGPPIWASTSVFRIKLRVSICSTTEPVKMKNWSVKVRDYLLFRKWKKSKKFPIFFNEKNTIFFIKKTLKLPIIY